MVTRNKGSGLPIWETGYIYEARKVKSDAQVATNKNSKPCAEIFPSGWLGRTVPLTKIFQNLWNCTKHVELGSSYSGCRLI